MRRIILEQHIGDCWPFPLGFKNDCRIDIASREKSPANNAHCGFNMVFIAAKRKDVIVSWNVPIIRKELR